MVARQHCSSQHRFEIIFLKFPRLLCKSIFNTHAGSKLFVFTRTFKFQKIIWFETREHLKRANIVHCENCKLLNSMIPRSNPLFQIYPKQIENAHCKTNSQSPLTNIDKFSIWCCSIAIFVVRFGRLGKYIEHYVSFIVRHNDGLVSIECEIAFIVVLTFLR